MIYTYLFTDKFFEDLRSNINSEQILHIIDFFKINFQTKENLHYCGTEDNLGNNFGVSGDNSEILNQFINSFHQTGALSNFLNKKDTADFIFCGNNEQIKKNGILTINCKKILNENESLKTQINNQTEDHWTNDDGKEDLSKKLKQLLKFSKLLVTLGIDSKNFFNKIKQQSTKADLKKLTSDAFEKEVFGAPTFIINNKIFWGQDRLEYALEELS